ncbi:hypothetical protein MMC13_008336 [Lambiella insularis]|nr:hypothetical protein [Lambiella insularis]
MPSAIPPSEKPFTVAVIGGGIGGLCLAVGLARHKIPFHVYEGASAFAEIGAGVGFGPNARQAMALIDHRITVGYEKHATTNHNEGNKDHFFQFRMGMDGRGKTKGLKAGDLISEPGGAGKGMNMIHRARFLDELIALIPKGCASFGKRLKIVETIEDGVRMHFEDGTTAEADVVIGCDGVKSKVRQTLFGKKSEARFTGKYAYRGLLPMHKAVDLLGEQRARNSQAYIGYGGHVLTMQVERGEIMNVVAFRTKPDSAWHNPTWVLPMREEDMNRDFADWGQDVKKILALMEKPDLWALFDHPPIPQLWHGRVCLLGDAGHASTPHQGSGAGMALEDAFVLSGLLGQVSSADELEAAFQAYSHVRHPRDMKLVETSRACGEVYQFLGPDTGDDVRKIDEDLRGRYDWIWEEDLTDELTRATEMFQRLRSRAHRCEAQGRCEGRA